MPNTTPPVSLLPQSEMWKYALKANDHVLFTPWPKQLYVMQEAQSGKYANLFVYGGRGGGKSVMARAFAHGMSLGFPGFKYIILRTAFPDLNRNHLIYLPDEVEKLGGSYNKTEHIVYYPNGSFGFYMQCFSADTEVLTKRGFVPFPNLQASDEIASRSKDGFLEYLRPSKVMRRQHDGPVVRINQHGVDYLVTPDHPILCWDAQGREVVFEAKDAAFHPQGRKGVRFLRTALWEGTERRTHSLTGVDKLKAGRPPKIVATVPMDEWLEFLGWYISEGSTSRSVVRGDYEIYNTQVYQSKYPDTVQRLHDLFRSWGFAPQITRQGKCVNVWGKQLYAELSPLGKCDEKYVPDYVKSLSSRQIMIFLTTLFKGDGSITDGFWRSYTTTSKRLADDVQELLLKVGLVGQVSGPKHHPGKKPTWSVSVSRQKLNPIFKPSCVSEEYYRGYVYDVTMPKEPTLLVRRNGKISWAHNCTTLEDVNKAVGAEAALVIFDEAPMFEWEHMIMIGASLRAAPDVPYHILGMYLGNPTGQSIDQLYAYCVDKDVDSSDDPLYNPDHWHAIRLDLADNPGIDAEQYLKRFSGLPSHIRRAWVEGERTLERTLFQIRKTVEVEVVDPDLNDIVKVDRPYHIIDELPTFQGESILDQPWVKIFGSYDHGFIDPAVRLWFAIFGRRIICFKESVWEETHADEIARQMMWESAGLRLRGVYCDPKIDIEDGSVESIKESMERQKVSICKVHGPVKGVCCDRAEKLTLRMECAVNDRELFADVIHRVLNEEAEPHIPRIQFLSGDTTRRIHLKNGHTIVANGCPYLIKSLPKMRWAENNPKKLDDHRHDHPVVALAYYMMNFIGTTKPVEPDPPMNPYLREVLYGQQSGRYVLGTESVKSRTR